MRNQNVPMNASIRMVFEELLSSPRILFAVLVLSPVHTLAPHLYSWYLSKFSSCHAAGSCNETFVDFLGWFELPLSLSLLMGITILCLLSRAIFWAVFEIKAADLMLRFFNVVITRLNNTRATWFDENPSGKLLNNLFGDFSSLQRRFIFSLSDGQVCYYELIVGIVMVGWISPLASIPILVLWFAIFWAQTKVNPAFDHVSRVSSKKKGLVIEVLSDVIEGAALYRSYQAEHHVLKRLQSKIEDWVKTEVFQWKMMTWAWTWMWLLAELGIALVVIAGAWAFHNNHISLAVAGMILLAAGQQQGIIPWTLDNIGGFLSSRAKALRFLNMLYLPSETHDERNDYPASDSNDDASCPLSGILEFKDLTCSYREDSAVILEGFDLKIPQGSKIALVGRTGAGKSTLIQALFRMVYVHRGDITLDAKSLYSFPPHTTREIFGIVPQNPWLFAGSLKENIDLKGEFEENDIKSILQELLLGHLDLNARVEEGGRNFSLGERQLLCLARCLLSDKKIIVMDEPTSNIDLETDAKVQKIIRTKLTGRTLIVIAHRKETVIDFEMIFSLEKKALIRARELDV